MLKPWRAEPDHTALFLQRYNALVTQARRVLRLSRAQATELVHEAFLHFVLNQPDLDAIAELDAYLFGMLRKLHVSHLRRAARQRTLSMAEYDSAALGLRDAAGTATLQALQELAQICAYCATRRHTSKAGSVLALRYFYGRSPAALALTMGASPQSVKQWLHLARREACEYLADPERTAAFGPPMLPARISLAVAPEDRLAALVVWLRQHPAGDCLTSDQIAALHTPAALDRPTLAHLVSCAACLSIVERTRLSEHREDPPTGGPPAAFGTRKAPARIAPKASHDDRLIELRAHRPAMLCVHVNGFLVGSHRLTSHLTHFTTRVHLAEAIEFIEVFSEQGVRLAFVEAPALGQPFHRAMRLDEDRSLDVSIDVSEPWPAITVEYTEPHFERSQAEFDAPPGGDAGEPAIDTSSRRFGLNDTNGASGAIGVNGANVAMPWRWRLPGHSLLAWSWPPLAWRLALLLFVVWSATSPAQAAELASRVWRYAVAAVQHVVGRRELSGRPVSPGSAPLAQAIVPAYSGPDMLALHSRMPAAALVDLDGFEIDLLGRIDRIGGLLGDEVTIDRINSPGHPRVSVRAIVPTVARKQEILAAIGVMARRPLVELDIATADEMLAAARARINEGGSSPLHMAQLSASRVPAYDAVRDALLRSSATAAPVVAAPVVGAPAAAPDIDAQVRRFSAEALNHSLRARLHARAAASLLDRCVERWPSLTPDVRRRWSLLVIAHARGVERETTALRTALEGMFSWQAAQVSPDDATSDWPASNASSASSADPQRDISALAQQLSESATRHDMTIGRAFAVSPDGAASGPPDATRGTFGDSLRDAERSARHLIDLVDRLNRP